MNEPTAGPYVASGSNAHGIFIVAPPTALHPDGLVVAIAPGPHRGIIDGETRATADLLSACWEMQAALECEEAVSRFYWAGDTRQDLQPVLERHGFMEDKETIRGFLARVRGRALAKARGEGVAT